MQHAWDIVCIFTCIHASIPTKLEILNKANGLVLEAHVDGVCRDIGQTWANNISVWLLAGTHLRMKKKRETLGPTWSLCIAKENVVVISNLHGFSTSDLAAFTTLKPRIGFRANMVGHPIYN